MQGRRVCPTSTASHVSRSLSFLGRQLEAAFVIASVRMQWHCVFPSPLISCWTLLVKAKDPSIRGAGCMPQTREGKKSLSSYPGSRATQHLSHPRTPPGLSRPSAGSAVHENHANFHTQTKLSDWDMGRLCADAVTSLNIFACRLHLIRSRPFFSLVHLYATGGMIDESAQPPLLDHGGLYGGREGIRKRGPRLSFARSFPALMLDACKHGSSALRLSNLPLKG